MKLRTLFLALMAGALASCSSIGYITYDRLQPAQVNFPAVIHRVGVLNAVPTGNEDMDDEGNLSGNGAVAVESLAQGIAESQYFDEVVVCDSVLRKEATQSVGLSSAEKDYFLESLGVDMLIVFNKVAVQLKRGEMFDPEFPYPIPVVDTHVTPEILIYVPEKSEPLYAIQKTDSLIWEYTDAIDPDQIVQEASEFAGELPVKLLVPFWKESIRLLFEGGQVAMRDAAVMAREGDWQEAADVWKKVYETSKDKRKAMAAYNLAVYHEYMGQFEEVRRYLDEALRLVKKGSTDEVIIQGFKTEFEKDFGGQQQLHLQMQRFENKNE